VNLAYRGRLGRNVLVGAGAGGVRLGVRLGRLTLWGGRGGVALIVRLFRGLYGVIR
jgi:hypothetical protein